MRGRHRRMVLGLLLVAASGIVPATSATAAEPPASGRIVEDIEVASHDGTVLRGHVVRPLGTEAVPVVLWSTPYAGALDPEVHDGTTRPVSGRAPVVPVDLLVEHGYAVAQVHVRGTGDSDGCFDLLGRDEQRDQAFLVEWLADRPWSTDRVGMIGQSYDAITALSAAIAAPEQLRTIVVSGIWTDTYTAAFSPQGAVMDDLHWSAGAGFFGGVSAAPPRPVLEGDPVSPYAHYLAGLQARYCPEARAALTQVTVDTLATEREAEFFEERRLLPRLGSVRAAVLLWHGFQETNLAFEEDRVWQALTAAPKWQWQGQWGHVAEPMANHTTDILLPWLDHWLKGEGGAPDGLGQVDYEVGHGEALNTEGLYGPEGGRDWRTSSAWPPAEAVETTLSLTRDGLRARPDRDGARTFRALPDQAQTQPTVDARTAPTPTGYAPPCPDVDGVTSLIYESAPLAEGTTIAGNPRARLRLESDSPAGSFSLQLFALGPDYGCGPGQDRLDYRFLTEGGADLRFVREGWGDPWHRTDRYVGRPFPTGRDVRVRVDLQSLAEHLPAGHRLAVVLSLGGQKARVAHGAFPRLTVHGSSRLVLPLVEGGIPG